MSPRTEAGRALPCTCNPLTKRLLIELLRAKEGDVHEAACRDTAIREAAAAERARLRTAVEGLPTSATVWTGDPLVYRAAVLDLLRDPE